MLEDELAAVIDERCPTVSDELDFEPVKPRGGLVSRLVRSMRDERGDSVLRALR